MRLHRLMTLLLALLLAVAPFEGVRASQGSLIMPTVGTVSGLTLVNDINAAFDALVTCNSGGTAPLNSAAAPSTGQWWCDNSISGKISLKKYDGTSWLVVAVLDTANHVWTPPIGGGVATSLASGSTVDLGSVPQSFVTITGTTGITAFGSSAVVGSLHFLKFSGALTLTHNATSLILPSNGANITTAAGDSLAAVYLGGSNWQVLQYQPATGAALNASSNFQGAVFLNARIAPSALAGNTNNWSPSGLSTANVIQFSCSSAINITGLTAPATDGQVIVLDNIGATNTCTATSQDANSTAANRFAFDRPIGIRPGRSITIKYDLTAARWRLIQENTAQPIAGGFKNLKIVNGGTPNNQLTVTADEITVEDASGGVARLASVNCTADITTNSFSSGVGGLDTGSVAQNQGYYVFVIYAPSTNTQSCLFSVNSTLGTISLPATYTFAARVGWDFVENQVGKRLNRMLCFGRRCQYVVTASSATPNLPIPISGTSGSVSTPTWTSVSLASLVPSTASQVFVAVTMASVSSVAQAAPNNGYGAFGSLTNPPPCVSSSSSNNGSTSPCALVIESGNIYYNSSGSSSALAIVGWEDNL